MTSEYRPGGNRANGRDDAYEMERYGARVSEATKRAGTNVGWTLGGSSHGLRTVGVSKLGTPPGVAGVHQMYAIRLVWMSQVTRLIY